MIESESAHATVPALPPELQSPRAKLVYLYLTTNGSATVSQMCDSLGMKKIALYSILKTLRKQDLIVRDDETYTLPDESRQLT